MNFTILDVGHGSCAYLLADNTEQNLMLFDCGHKTDPEIRPSSYLRSIRQRSVELLFISNYDEDHISDLPSLVESFDIRAVVKNKTISADQLAELKYGQSGKISPAMESLLDIIRTYTGGPPTPAAEFPGTTYCTFHNDHPFNGGDDTNNISLVTFLTVNGTTILLPGDLEVEGWRKLLRNRDFSNRLSDVNIFVASHHGRENGYCAEVFTEFNCRPWVFVFSDSDKEYTTQEMTATYAHWASGVEHNGRTRKVFTTRSDGPISWDL